MKTIIYTISSLQRSGPVLVLYGLVKNLDRNKFKPIIIILSDKKENSLRPEFEKLGVEIVCLNKKGLSAFFMGIFEIRKIINQIKPDIIHSNGFRDIVLTAFALSRKYKKCATIHCDWEVDYKLRYGNFRGFIIYWFQKQTLKFIDRCIACSEMLADLLNKKYPNMHFDFVDNGVDTEKFLPVKDKVALRKKLALPIDKKIIIWAGSFIPRKAPLAMVKAIKKIPQNKYYFIFCGARGPLLNVCKEELKKRTDVLFTGYIANIDEYYKASDIYVSTSLSEGLPLAVLEAEFCGLLPLLSDIAQHRYILAKEAYSDCIYREEKELFEKLTYLLTKDTSNLLSVIAKNMKIFSAENMSKKYQEIYASIK